MRIHARIISTGPPPASAHETRLMAGRRAYLISLSAEGRIDTSHLIPPDVEHSARVVGNENWVAVAAYCDECPVLKKALNKEPVHYPLANERE